MSSPRFHDLTIADIRLEARDAVSIGFNVPDALKGAFAFEQGQYLTLRTEIGGEDIRRSYSICTGEGEALRVAVKAVPGGAFSTFANEILKPGQIIKVMTPMGRFGAKTGKAGGHIVCFAAGSGITPILSIIRTRLAADESSRITLFYGNRGSSQILFREDLEDLKDRHLGRLAVHHILSREQQDVPLLNGRLSAEKITALLPLIGDLGQVDDVYLCGPDDMTTAGKAVLEGAGLEAKRIQIELFTTGASPPRAGKAVVVEAVAGTPLTLTHDGQSHALTIQPGETVLEAAERAGLDVPYSCRGGMCCTCRARVTEGTGAMDVNFSLEPWEVEAGFVLTCQCRPTSERIGIDFDAV